MVEIKYLLSRKIDLLPSIGALSDEEGTVGI
jgi:hypothetical protein